MNMGRTRRAMAAAAITVLLSGCAAVATSALVSAGPELIASSLGQFRYRSEFDETIPLIKARDWNGLSALALRKLALEPGRGEWWQIAGYGYLQAGEPEKARDSLARAVRMVPEDVGGWNLYAVTLARLGDKRAAALALERALQTDPTSTLAWVLSGDMKADEGRLREAAQAYERALEIDKRDVFAWLGLGRAAKRAGDGAVLERAVTALKALYPPFAEQLAAPN